ncbi:hypothetical protein TNCV_3960621 [Trichonephila clavipes]|nr:hypothetical protein TNCV_3960621 [Trichonephila clavipes]
MQNSSSALLKVVLSRRFYGKERPCRLCLEWDKSRRFLKKRRSDNSSKHLDPSFASPVGVGNHIAFRPQYWDSVIQTLRWMEGRI